ncbi:autotransporter domain protein [Campylobacter pinnipediorum subsp. caledonicus]|uniref:autotransporter domain-containing protein n=1 Tax=Campylobacter pinnipediorum TaxID=1965231 RepID=UPI0009959421|nr:autotransporter domain-containing protein [Campylobacter pinnipediorum]AQW85635.1 autotransporter domain protein [Campylobacter pinnipediorum subsp. caledonicus]
MKISKIVSAAILSVAVSSVAFAADAELKFYKEAKKGLADIVKNKAELGETNAEIQDQSIKDALKAILEKAKDAQIPQEGLSFTLGKDFGKNKDQTITLELKKDGDNPQIIVVNGDKKDVITLNNDTLSFQPYEDVKNDLILKNLVSQEGATGYDFAKEKAKIETNKKNLALKAYIDSITKDNGQIFKDVFVTKKAELANLEANLAGGEDHPVVQKVVDVLTKAKSAKEAGNLRDSLNITDLVVGTDLKLSLDVGDQGKQPKILIKKGTAGEFDTITLNDQGNGLAYTKNAELNNDPSIIKLFLGSGDLSTKIDALKMAKVQDTDLGKIIEVAKENKAKAEKLDTLREKIVEGFEALKTPSLETYANTSADKRLDAVDTKVKAILTAAKEAKNAGVDFENGLSVELVNAGTSNKALSFKLVKDDTADVKFEITLGNKTDTFTLAEGKSGDLATSHIKDGLKYEPNASGSAISELTDNNLETEFKITGDKLADKIKENFDKLAKAEKEKDAYGKKIELLTLITDDLTNILVTNKDKIATITDTKSLKEADSGNNNTIKDLLKKAKEFATTNDNSGEAVISGSLDLSVTLENINGSSVVLTLKPDKNTPSLEITADGKKDVIGLNNDDITYTPNSDSFKALSILSKIGANELTNENVIAHLADVTSKAENVDSLAKLTALKSYLSAIYTTDENNILNSVFGEHKATDLAALTKGNAGELDQATQTALKNLLTKANDAIKAGVSDDNINLAIADLESVKLEVKVEGESNSKKAVIVVSKEGKEDKLSLGEGDTLVFTPNQDKTANPILKLLANFDPVVLDTALTEAIINKKADEIANLNENQRVDVTVDNADEVAAAGKLKDKELADAQKAKTDADAEVIKAQEKVAAAGDNQEAKATAEKELETAKTKATKAADNVKKLQKTVAKIDEALADTPILSKAANKYLETADGELKTKEKALMDAEKALADAPAEQKAAKQQNLNTAKEQLETAKKEVVKAKAELAEVNTDRAVRATKGLSALDQGVAKAFGTISAESEVLRDQLSTDEANKATVVKLVKEISTSVDTTVDSISKTSSMDAVRANTDLSTSTRLAQLTNPFNDDMALASAINKLSSDSFASSDNYALSNVVREYTDRFNYNSNIWGSVMGGKTSVKDGANPKIFGVTIGYDRRFDNSIAGLTTTYAQSKADGNNVETKGKNYQFGVYTRSYFDQNELDARLNFNFGKNKLERSTSVTKTDAKYDSFVTSVDMTYGYVYGLNNDLFIKPLAGFEYSYMKTKAFTENGVGALNFNSIKAKLASLKAGVELRKYVDGNNYFYATPGVESEVYKDSNDVVVRFVGTNDDIRIAANDKKNTYFTLQTGANFNITDSLSTNINFGTKLGSKNKFYNGTIGVNYKF